MIENNPQPTPEVLIVGQYVRDLSFGNIRSKEGGSDNAQPSVQVQVTVDAKKLQAENRFESSVKLKISSKGKGTDKVLFLLDVDYVGVFQIKNIPEDQLEAILMIECPRLTFPFLRRVVSDMIRDGGFPPLNLENIDFMSLYRKEVARRQPEQQPLPDA